MHLRIISAVSSLFMLQEAALGRQGAGLQAPQLITPAEHASILQNVESAFCSKTGAGGFGYSIQFAWSSVPGAARYELFVEHQGSTAPALDRVTQQVSFEQQQCGAFVTDANLTQWNWRVRASPESGEPGPWSEMRQFEFAPCRLLDGTPCRAPANDGSNMVPGQPEADGIYRIGGEVTAPTLIQKFEPEYTDEARTACASGSVLLSLIVDREGMPRDIRVKRPLGMGLDEKAIEAVSKWRFKPALKSGQPVAVRAQVEVNFGIQCNKN